MKLLYNQIESSRLPTCLPISWLYNVIKNSNDSGAWKKLKFLDKQVNEEQEEHEYEGELAHKGAKCVIC